MSNGSKIKVRGTQEGLSAPAMHDMRNTGLKIDTLNSNAVKASPVQQIYTVSGILVLARVSVSSYPTRGLSLVAHSKQHG